MRGEFLDLSGARVYYYAAGTRGAGEPVVFLHGFPTSSHLWSDVVPLMPPGHRLVVADLLGYGRSDRPAAGGVDIGAHARRVIELLAELRIERACIVGHGIGGGVAQVLALQYAASVSRLALIDSIAFDRWPSIEARIARFLLPLARVLPPRLLLAALRREVARGYRDPERAARSMDLYLRPFGGADGRDALIAHVRALARDDARPLNDRLRCIAAPTAIVWGQSDRVTPLWVGRRLQQAIPQATLDVVPGAGHLTPEDAPRQVADAVARLLAR